MNHQRHGGGRSAEHCSAWGQWFRRPSEARRSVLLPLILSLVASGALAGVDVPALQQKLTQGQAGEVRLALDQELARDPENPHLLYNRAVTAYAEGRFEEALLDLDLVESSRSRSLVSKARFQKGNADFRLGLNARPHDVEAAIARWKQSVASYDALLKENPKHIDAQKNREQVRKLLLETLLKRAEENLQKGEPPAQPADQRIQSLRNAMEQFHDAGEMKPEGPQAQEAKAGEEKAKDLLAQALAEEGTRKTLANNMVMPRQNEPPVMRPDVAQIQEGVHMLEDASSLKPNDQNIAQQLDQGRERLAFSSEREQSREASGGHGVSREPAETVARGKNPEDGTDEGVATFVLPVGLRAGRVRPGIAGGGSSLQRADR